ncbi:hypothetical protein IWQ57_000688 [Coemansia nantahalensis]|uniref:Uncharacterized protein n=1 Tax=Coemansia nantahalensis TaxID=2789366 RepID=A0ACC1K6R7_9FUNG|nr:hypothetical protein IWQ57_000688 [Coemansia nantahalensis]
MSSLSTRDTYYAPFARHAEATTPYLQYIPSLDVAYGAGGVFAALFLAILALAALARARVFGVALVGSACLVVSMFLRGSLARDMGRVHMYEASLVLETCGANAILLLAVLLLARWVQFLHGARSPFTVLLAAAGAAAAASAGSLECAAIPLVFGASEQRRHVGHLLRIGAMSVTLAYSGLGLLVTAWKATASAPRVSAEAAALAGPFAMLSVWASFMLAQAKLPATSAASSSEAAFYLLGVLPLGLALLLWVALNAPRLFSHKDLPLTHRAAARWSGHYDCHYRYPSLPADHDYSYPVRVPGPAPQPGSSGRRDKVQQAVLRYS